LHLKDKGDSKEYMMNNTNIEKSRTLRLTQLAVLSAIVLLMAFTPLGYLRVGPLSITFLTVPVVLGALLLGPWEGAVLGAVFGATSFAQCFGMDAFGTALLTINPFYAFILCFVPRILIGIFSGLLLKKLAKTNMNQTLAYTMSALTGVLTNTVFFVGFLIIFYGHTDFLRSFGDSTLAIIGVLVSANAVIEAVVSTIIATALVRVLKVALRKMTV